MRRSMKRSLYLLLTALVLLLAVLVWRRGGLPAPAPAARVLPELPAAAKREAAPAADPVAARIAAMTKEEKVWQLLVLFPEQVTGVHSTADAAVWSAGLAARPVGGLTFDGDNISSEAALRDMLSAAAAAGKTPPFLCVDEEGGAVARVAYALGVTTDLKPMYTYREEGGGTAYENALTLGSEIGDFGFNVDFAPVADVWTNPANTVVGSRAYSDDPAEAAALVASAVRGFADSGMISVLKHFPGHGATAEDSHVGAAVCGKTLSELEACELLPFASGIAAGADMVMVGHITLPAVDPDAPATLSGPVVTGLLREKLGFDGVVITDALRMEALSAYSGPEAALLALEAGCDLLLAPEAPEAVAAYLLERVPESRLDESLRRILTLKLAHGILQ